jgi:dipeptidyl aminopeptidase/acylaminoacyl peptidase
MIGHHVARQLFVWVQISGLLFLCVWDAAMGGQRRFEVRDSIETARFSDVGILSPDGHWFATVTQRGQLPKGETEASLWLIDALSIQQDLERNATIVSKAPVLLARMTGAIYGGEGPAFGRLIMQVKWNSKSDSVLFLGRDGRENRQIFRVPIQQGQPMALTPAAQDVVDYAENGSQIAYLAGPTVVPEKVWWSNNPAFPDVVTGTGRSFFDLLYPSYAEYTRDMPTNFEVWKIADRDVQPVIDKDAQRPLRVLGSYNVSAMGFSPDNRKLVAITHALVIPPDWAKYKVPGDGDSDAFHPDPALPSEEADRQQFLTSDFSRAVQYQAFDLLRGTVRPLLQAPVVDFLRGGSDALSVKWSPEGRYVAVTSTYLPISASDHPNGHSAGCGLAVVDSVTFHYDCLWTHTSDSTSILAISWERSDRLKIDFSDSTESEYQHRSHVWKRRARQSNQPPTPTQFSVEEGLDESPRLIAKNRRTEHQLTVMDPNPQLRGIALGTVAPYHWTDSRGTSVVGGLAKPPDFAAGHQYPLVIQTHGFPQDRFFTTGYGSETAGAARALAARGIVVLQVQEPQSSAMGTWREAAERGTQVYLAAIDRLTADGIVDPTRVGITGYSRRGPYVIESIESAPRRFAAAFVGSTIGGSIEEYYFDVDAALTEGTRKYAEFIAGRLPYGAGLNDWMQRAPALLTDKIVTPVAISASSPEDLISLWNLYAPLRDQGRAVELQYIRTGQHNLTKPLQIWAHQELLVDWFDFWLNRHEDPATEKARQYERWRGLRAAQLRSATQSFPN